MKVKLKFKKFNKIRIRIKLKLLIRSDVKVIFINLMWKKINYLILKKLF